MDINAVLRTIETTSVATRIRDGIYLFPFLEAAHVFCFSMVVGTIAVIDLRLLGLASTHRPFKRIASDILKWTWVAFAFTVLTGLLMFITNPRVYYANTFFRIKMLLLVLAGINMAIFELTAGRTIHQWEREKSAPRAGKAVAVMSLALWISIIFMGRMIGFTTKPGVIVAPPSNIDFDNFLGGPGSGSAPSTPAPAPTPKPPPKK